MKQRKDYMTGTQWDKMAGPSGNANPPRTHKTCMELTGVSRPGKTRQDKDKRGSK